MKTFSLNSAARFSDEIDDQFRIFGFPNFEMKILSRIKIVDKYDDGEELTNIVEQVKCG